MSRFRRKKQGKEYSRPASAVEQIPDLEPDSDKRVVLETITPTRAQTWLRDSHDAHNRPVQPEKVRTYAEMMRAGRWKESGQPIHFDENRQLMNGQHRLRAVVESGKTIKEWVAYGFPRELFAVLDTGLRRTPGQVASMAGYKDANLLAASAVWMARYDSRKMHQNVRFRLSNQEVLDLMAKHPALVESIPWGRKVSKFRAPSMWVALHYILAKKDRTLADAFFDSLATGQNMRPEDPTYVLRERLISNAAARFPIAPEDLFYMAVRTWNALREGRTVKKMAIPRPDADTPEVR